MANKIVVGVGEILWDVFPQGKALGGAPANFAYHMSQLGYDGYAVSAVGDDRPGVEILEHLQGKGLKYLIETVPYPTGTVVVELYGAGIPRYSITENTAWDHVPFTARTERLAGQTVAACYGILAQRSDETRKTIREFISAMPKESRRILDINLRGNYYGKPLIDESLTISDILKINDEELATVAELFGLKGGEEDICRTLMERYDLAVVILTKGIDGSHIFSSRESSSLPTPQVEVADTVGAGDSFTAAFTAAYLRGDPVREAHRQAVELSAFVCTRRGAMPVLAEHFK